MIYEQLELRITNEAYHFTPLIEPAKKSSVMQTLETLTIYRNSGQLQLNAPLVQNVESELVVYGILGFIKLQAGEYMIIITGYEIIGSLLQDAHIFRATTFQILPVFANHQLTNQQLEDEQRYIYLIENHLKQNCFYYSFKYNITLSMQKQGQLIDTSQVNDWRIADSRFFWNRYLCEKLITATSDSKLDQDFSRFILPVIQGFVSIHSAVINNRPVTFSLISRKSQERAGTRYFSRGLDEFGFAANFVESEQVLLCDPSKALTQTNLIRASFVQTRGSLPALWGQSPNTRYTPKLWFHSDLTDEKVLNTSRAHFDQQIKYYGPQILVNLVNTKGYELPVGQLYENIVKELNDPNLKYIHFDFHHECRKMKWNRVQLLIDQLEADLRKQGYYLYNTGVQKLQSSVVRSNCMDCLDRTNVVQSTIARWVLNRQLRKIGILQSTEVIENDDQFMQIFKNVWADNADGLSISYSGTGALKTDFTRTGRRTRLGMLNDFNNSVMRYIKNNYMDGSRQDGIDLILGKYRVSSRQSPFKTEASSWLIKLMPLYLIVSFVSFMVLLFSSSIESSLLYMALLSFLFSVTITCWLYIQQNGHEFVDWPKLLPCNKEIDIVETLKPVQKATDLIQKLTFRRNSSVVLNEIEQGYELGSLKKTT